jgi:hypothetical protein
MAEEKHPVTGGLSETEDGAISQEMQEIFDKATAKIIGVDYTPVELIGTQIVNGINYRFLCKAKTFSPSATARKVVVTVYQKLNGEAVVLDIVNLDQSSASYTDTCTNSMVLGFRK